MDQSLCDKLNALPAEDRKRFCFERNKVFENRDYAIQKYGLTDEDYNNLPADKVAEVDQKIYNKLFENREKKD